MAEATPKAAGGAVRAFDARARKQFLDHLAMTANVAASARKAGVTSQTAYAYRRRHPEFAALWQAALSEGFARLEQDLLAAALSSVSGKTSDAMLKGRAQKHRLADTQAVALAADPGRATNSADLIHGPTRLMVVELPWLDAGISSSPLIVAAAAGPQPGWRRAALFQSTNQGTSSGLTSGIARPPQSWARHWMLCHRAGPMDLTGSPASQ